MGIQNAKEYIGVGLNANHILQLYKKNIKILEQLNGEASAILIQKEIEKYPKNLQVFNGRGQEIIDNFLAGCSGIILRRY